MSVSTVKLATSVPAQIEATTCIEEAFGGIISYALVFSAFIHLTAPRYSPFLWLRGCEQYDGTQFADSKTAATVKKIQDKIEHYRQKMGIASPIAFMVNSGSFYGVAQGLAGIPNVSSPVIATGVDELQMKDEEMDALLCHELAHIKNQDTLKVLALCATVTVISAVVAPIFAGMTGLAMTIYSMAEIAIFFTALSYFSTRIEKQADLDACETLGTAKGLISLCEDIQKHHLKIREKGSWFKKLLITADGDVRYDIFHPALKDRIHYLKEFEAKRKAPAAASAA